MMDGRGGCCIARYTGGGGAYDMTKVDHIMLRYRPIAPKPAVGGSSFPASETYVKTVRAKRKYVRDGNSKKRACKTKGSKKRKSGSSSAEEKTSSGGSGSGSSTGPETTMAVVTLPLLPETPERKEESPSGGSNSPMWLNFGNRNDNPVFPGAESGKVGLDQAAVVLPRVAGTVVTVEGVMDTWVDCNSLGCTDEERVMNLGRDTCPGFVSDGLGRVCWTNRALREMVVGCEEEVMVWLVMKERAPITCGAFTCRVRVQNMTVPCDVWRMDSGALAWRLDVKAALCLGR